jgi:hypothetical protein
MIWGNLTDGCYLTMMSFITSNWTLLKSQLAQKNSKSINPLKERNDLTCYGLSKFLESNCGQLYIKDRKQNEAGMRLTRRKKSRSR